jgi:hypothetical protein
MSLGRGLNTGSLGLVHFRISTAFDDTRAHHRLTSRVGDQVRFPDGSTRWQESTCRWLGRRQSGVTTDRLLLEIDREVARETRPIGVGFKGRQACAVTAIHPRPAVPFLPDAKTPCPCQWAYRLAPRVPGRVFGFVLHVALP